MKVLIIIIIIMDLNHILSHTSHSCITMMLDN